MEVVLDFINNEVTTLSFYGIWANVALCFCNCSLKNVNFRFLTTYIFAERASKCGPSLHEASALLQHCLYVGRVVKILWGRIIYVIIINLNNRGSSASEECDIPPRVGAITSAKERVIPPPCAWLHWVQDLVEMSTDCPLELWSWLVKLSQSCDKIITNRETQQGELEGGRNWL